MKNSNTQACYDESLLQRFLESDVSTVEEDAVVAHIAECKKCREKQRTLTGGDDVWEQLGESLGAKSAKLNAEWDLNETIEDMGSVGRRDLKHIQSLLGPTDDPTKIGRLGQYEVCGIIGRGSAGVVVKAMDTRLNRFVAIKLLTPAYSNLGSSRRRFEREGRAIASVKNPHVVPIHTVDEFNGTPYIVMQYIPDGSLQQRIEKAGPLSTREVACLGMQVATGLAAAHARGIVHRDVKPANVLLENGIDGAMVTDFGLARVVDEATMTHSGSISGTPQYMSPEQAKGERVDPRSDLFSLGSLMYAASTGHAPFRSESVFGIIKKVCDDQPRNVREFNPDIEPWLVGLIERLHEKEPGSRFESADEVASILSAELAHLQNPTLVEKPARSWWVSKPVPPTKPIKKDSSKVGKLVMAIALLIAGGVGWFGLSQLMGMFEGEPEWHPTVAAGHSGEHSSVFVISSQELTEYAKTITESIDVEEGGTIFLKTNYGNISALTHDKPSVEFKMVTAVEADQQETAQKWFDKIKLGFDVDQAPGLSMKKGEDAVIIAKMPANDGDKASGLKIKKVRMEVLFPEKFNLIFNNEAGNITAANVEGEVQMKCSAGNITLGNVSGDTELITSAGNIRVGNVGGDCTLEAQSGTLSVQNVEGDFEAKTDSGNVTSGNVSGMATAKSPNGLVMLGHIEGDVIARSESGSVKVWKVEGNADVESNAGAISVNFVGQPEGKSKLKTVAGAIRVGYLDDLDFDIAATTQAGMIKAPFLEAPQKSIEFKLNDGKQPLVLETNAGSIQLDVFDLDRLRIPDTVFPEMGEGRNAFNRAYDLHMEGRIDEAVDAHIHAATFPEFKGIATYNLACAYALQGKKKKALKTLKQAVEFGFVDYEQYQTDSDLDSLRDAPEFEKILESVESCESECECEDEDVEEEVEIGDTTAEDF